MTLLRNSLLIDASAWLPTVQTRLRRPLLNPSYLTLTLDLQRNSLFIDGRFSLFSDSLNKVNTSSAQPIILPASTMTLDLQALKALTSSPSSRQWQRGSPLHQPPATPPPPRLQTCDNNSRPGHQFPFPSLLLGVETLTVFPSRSGRLTGTATALSPRPAVRKEQAQPLPLSVSPPPPASQDPGGAVEASIMTAGSMLMRGAP